MFNNFVYRLKASWEILLQQFEVEPREGQKVFSELVSAYSSIGRFYHTLEHIRHVLETIEQIRRDSSFQTSLAINFSAIQLAGWFHDVVYDPKAKNNEEKSADYAVKALKKWGIPIATVDCVKELILSTKTHQASTANLDSQILLDSDLAILGSAELEYLAYAQAIRKEYSWVDEQLYRVRRKQVLEKFLQRERVYCTNYMFNNLEMKARQNMQSEIVVLSSDIDILVLSNLY